MLLICKYIAKYQNKFLCSTNFVALLALDLVWNHRKTTWSPSMMDPKDNYLVG